MLKWFYHNNPDKIDRFIESISPNQIDCKQWLVDSFDNVIVPCQDFEDRQEIKVEIIGGWFGFPLIEMLVQRFGDKLGRVSFFEMDPFACRVLGRYIQIIGRDNLPPINIHKQDYFEYKNERRAHLIINTSCEHMQDMKIMKEYYIKPERTLVVMQSNDKDDEPDHINCVSSCDELAEQGGFDILWGGSKTLTSGAKSDNNMVWWNRFMVMGKWK